MKLIKNYYLFLNKVFFIVFMSFQMKNKCQKKLNQQIFQPLYKHLKFTKDIFVVRSIFFAYLFICEFY